MLVNDLGFRWFRTVLTGVARPAQPNVSRSFCDSVWRVSK
jgi:hypothetical protein